MNKSRKKTGLIAARIVLGVLLALAAAAGGLYLVTVLKPPDIGRDTERTLKRVFYEIDERVREAGEVIESAEKKSRASLVLTANVDSEALGLKNELSLDCRLKAFDRDESAVITMKAGNAKIIFSLTESISGGKGGFSVTASPGGSFRGWIRDTWAYDIRGAVGNLRDSNLNPANSPDSPLNAEQFGLLEAYFERIERRMNGEDEPESESDGYADDLVRFLSEKADELAEVRYLRDFSVGLIPDKKVTFIVRAEHLIRLADLIQEYAEKHGDEKILFGMSASGIADSLKETAEKAAPTAAVTLTDRRGTLSSLSVDLTFTASPALAPSDFRFLSAKDETGDRFVLKIDVTFDEGQGTRDPADSRSCVADFRIERADRSAESRLLTGRIGYYVTRSESAVRHVLRAETSEDGEDERHAEMTFERRIEDGAFTFRLENGEEDGDVTASGVFTIEDGTIWLAVDKLSFPYQQRRFSRYRGGKMIDYLRAEFENPLVLTFSDKCSEVLPPVSSADDLFEKSGLLIQHVKGDYSYSAAASDFLTECMTAADDKMRSMDGYVLDPSSAYQSACERYARMYVNALNECYNYFGRIDRSAYALRLSDENTQVWYVLLYDQDTRTVYAYPYVDLDLDTVKNTRLAWIENGKLLMEDDLTNGRSIDDIRNDEQ